MAKSKKPTGGGGKTKNTTKAPVKTKSSLEISKKDKLPVQKRGAGGKFVSDGKKLGAKSTVNKNQGAQTNPRSNYDDLTLLQKLEQGARQKKLKKFSTSSYNWFREKVKSFGGNKAREALLWDALKTGTTRTRPTTGYMYTFVYDAKHKSKLPYWDAFPLILMVGPAKKGFYGINLHYLPPKARAIFFDKLLDISSDRRYNQRTKIMLSYQILKAASTYSEFKPMFKHYLFNHVQSKLVMIPANEWEAALFLPTADFIGASNSAVWSDSLLKV